MTRYLFLVLTLPSALLASDAPYPVWTVKQAPAPIWHDAINTHEDVPQKYYGWPKDVAKPVGLRYYTPTRTTQRIAVTDGHPSHQWYGINKDDVFQNSATLFNPNRQAPWRVSGGMEGLRGWKSFKLTNVKKENVHVWNENIPISGSGRNLPGYRWAYPDGTVFADLLTNNDERVFELRTRTKEKGMWKAEVIFEDAEAAPKGYKGAGRCNDCHPHAGSSKQYGIMVSGDDTVFSFNPKVY